MARWDKLSQRGNVEDRRGVSAQGIGGGLGLVGFAAIIVFSLIAGGDTSQIIGTVLEDINNTQATQQTDVQPEEFAGEDDYEVFVSTVLGSANETWANIFAQTGQTYDEPRLVLFRGSTSSRCGGATAAIGPHYCPADSTIYIDETFFDELQSRFGARGGDVAEAYVVAHEVAHHVQYELNLDSQIDRSSNQDSVNFELQADCFAGIWAHSISDLGVFEPGEIDEAIDAAEAVGDDRIQERTTGTIRPEDWTHGSSAQRKAWFERGYSTGQPSSCTI